MPARWHVLYTEPGLELVVRSEIGALGFEAYVPTYRAEIISCGRKRRTRRPAFTRYVFVRFDRENDEWGCIASAKGVLYPLGDPSPISDAEVNEIKRLESIGFYDEVSGGRARILVGDIVRVIDGPFEGHTGKFVADHGKLVGIVIDAFQRATPIKMRLECLELLKA
jgi:transcriptional antiterminator NusG